MKKISTAQRLQQVMNEKNIKQVDILKMAEPYCKKYDVKLNKSDISQFVNGKNEPGQWKLTVLGLALNVSEAWLMGYDVPKERDAKSAESLVPAGFEPLPKMVKIPLIGEIACGTPILAEQNIDDYVDCPVLCKATFALQCHGDSMIGAEIHDGDIIFIRKQSEVENGQIAAVQIDGGDCYNATLKRFYRTGDTVTLMAENPNFPPLTFHNEEINRIHIAGRAVYCLSKVK